MPPSVRFDCRSDSQCVCSFSLCFLAVWCETHCQRVVELNLMKLLMLCSSRRVGVCVSGHCGFMFPSVSCVTQERAETHTDSLNSFNDMNVQGNFFSLLFGDVTVEQSEAVSSRWCRLAVRSSSMCFLTCGSSWISRHARQVYILILYVRPPVLHVVLWLIPTFRKWNCATHPMFYLVPFSKC